MVLSQTVGLAAGLLLFFGSAFPIAGLESSNSRLSVERQTACTGTAWKLFSMRGSGVAFAHSGYVGSHGAIPPALCRAKVSGKPRSSHRSLSLRSANSSPELEGCTPLEKRIMDKYIETFPAYSMEADRELLQRRARESIDRARGEFVEGLDGEGVTELSDEGLSTSERAEKFFSDESVRAAATDYVWAREMARITTQDQNKTRATFAVTQVLTFVLFAPIWWFFFTNVPTREFKEVFAYSSKVVSEFMSQSTGAPF